MANLLEFKNVSKIYKRGKTETVALDNLSLTLKDDEPTILTVAGESGSGKTTLAMLLLGLIEPSLGEIYYKGKDISLLSGAERMTFRKEVQAVFQDPFAVFNPFIPLNTCLKYQSNVLSWRSPGQKPEKKWQKRLLQWAYSQMKFLVVFLTSFQEGKGSVSILLERWCYVPKSW